MKITIFLLLILCTAAVFGQTSAGSVSSQPQMVTVPDHPLHAELHALGTERPLVGGGSDTYTYAQGERPLWEFGPVSQPPTPLGDVARAYRKEKVAAKKAEIIFEKQGS